MRKIFFCVLMVIVAGGCSAPDTLPQSQKYVVRENVRETTHNIYPPKGIILPVTYQLTDSVVAEPPAFWGEGNHAFVYLRSTDDKNTDRTLVERDLYSGGEKVLLRLMNDVSAPLVHARYPDVMVISATDDEQREHKSGEQGDFHFSYPAIESRYRWTFPASEIYILNISSGQRKRVTHALGYDAEASWNPAGNRLVFTSFRHGDLDLYVMDWEGGNQRRWLKRPGYDGGARFSPNGHRLVWHGFHATEGFSTIYVGTYEHHSTQAITDDKAIHFGPAWHPSGSWIVYASNRDGVDNFELYVTDVEGKCHRRMTYSRGSEILPTFTPDGKYVVFVTNQSGANFSRFLIKNIVSAEPALHEIKPWHLGIRLFELPTTPCVQ